MFLIFSMGTARNQGIGYGHKQDRQAKDTDLAINFRVRREWIVRTLVHAQKI